MCIEFDNNDIKDTKEIFSKLNRISMKWQIRSEYKMTYETQAVVE